MTVDEFLTWQPGDEKTRYELDEGIIYVSPSPVRWHQKVVAYVWREIDNFVRRETLGEASFDTDSVISRRRRAVFRPDVYFIRAERLSLFAGKGHLIHAPDLVVEVTSEYTRHSDMRRKYVKYEQNRDIREYWIIDIVSEPMEAFLYSRRGERFIGGPVEGPKLRSRLLKGFELDLETVWQRAMEGRD
jgi:Uma2 family endonuclease